MLQLRKRCLKLNQRVALVASETLDGSWIVWLEQDSQPICPDVPGKPKVFEAPTRYQAQCKASRWWYAYTQESGQNSAQTPPDSQKSA